MKAKNIVNLLEFFNEFLPDNNKIKIRISNPWHFSHSSDHNIPFAHSPGIFFFVYSDGKWNISLEKNDNDILYVGKADKSISHSVIREMRHINHDKFPLLGTPPYNNHRWRQNPDIKKKVFDIVSNGHLVLYTLFVESSLYDIYVIHSYLLNCFYKEYGQFPPLNDKNPLKNI